MPEAPFLEVREEANLTAAKLAYKLHGSNFEGGRIKRETSISGWETGRTFIMIVARLEKEQEYVVEDYKVHETSGFEKSKGHNIPTSTFILGLGDNGVGISWD